MCMLVALLFTFHVTHTSLWYLSAASILLMYSAASGGDFPPFSSSIRSNAWCTSTAMCLASPHTYTCAPPYRGGCGAVQGYGGVGGGEIHGTAKGRIRVVWRLYIIIASVGRVLCVCAWCVLSMCICVCCVCCVSYDRYCTNKHVGCDIF